MQAAAATVGWGHGADAGSAGPQLQPPAGSAHPVLRGQPAGHPSQAQTLGAAGVIVISGCTVDAKKIATPKNTLKWPKSVTFGPIFFCVYCMPLEIKNPLKF